MKKLWYVIQSYSTYENYVKLKIENILNSSELNNFFGDILVPVEELVETKLGKKKKIFRKLFPGYIFINMVMNDETWNLIKKIPKVIGFVGGRSDKPIPMLKKEIEKILSITQPVDGSIPKPKVIFDVETTVRILDGPFKDFSGVVKSVNYEKSKIQVAVSIFGRSTPVELEFFQVEKE